MDIETGRLQSMFHQGHCNEAESDLMRMSVTSIKNVFQIENKFYNLNEPPKSSNDVSTESFRKVNTLN